MSSWAGEPTPTAYWWPSLRPGCASASPWRTASDPVPGAPGQPAQTHAHCSKCSAGRTFTYTCRYATDADGPRADQINPGDEPSSIIDLGQWLGLYHMLIESDPSRSAGPEARRAALCLAEALKFYVDDELPPPSAFFTPATAAAFREHPENFARQKLRDMRARLPSPPAAPRPEKPDRSPPKHGRWPFGRR